jgi:hypothetical protein
LIRSKKGDKGKEGKKENGQKKKSKKKAKGEEEQMNASVKIQLPVVKVDSHANGMTHWITGKQIFLYSPHLIIYLL